jgi:hypothetical protein
MEKDNILVLNVGIQLILHNHWAQKYTAILTGLEKIHP